MKPAYYLSLRTYAEGRFVSLWLCRRDGKSRAFWSLLYGEVIPQVAEEIVQALGLPVERDASPFTAIPTRPNGTATPAEQQALFPEAV